MSRTNFNDPGRFGSKYSCDPLGNRFINQEVLAEPTAFRATHRAQNSEFGIRNSELPTRPKTTGMRKEKIRNPKSEPAGGC
jgi:hypothetical protein